MSNNYLDLFYKEARGFSSSNDLTITDVRDSLTSKIRGLDEQDALGLYSASTRRFVQFLIGAKLLLNFKTVAKFFFHSFKNLFTLKKEKLREGMKRIMSSRYNGTVVSGDGSLGSFLSENNINTPITDTFLNALKSLDEASKFKDSIFKTSSFLSENRLVSFGQDQNNNTSTSANSNKESVDDAYSDNSNFIKLFDVGQLSDSGLNSNQQYFSIPEFIMTWCEYAEGFSEKATEKSTNKESLASFMTKVKETKALAEKAHEESLNTYNKIIEADNKVDADFYEKNIQKRSITINKKDKVRMADESIKEYYKQALKDVSGDPLMKEFYSGMADFYGEKQAMNDSRKRKDLFDFFLDESDITSSSHKESVMLSKSLGEGGLVENGHQSKKKHVDVARRNPSGNFKNK